MLPCCAAALQVPLDAAALMLLMWKKPSGPLCSVLQARVGPARLLKAPPRGTVARRLHGICVVDFLGPAGSARRGQAAVSGSFWPSKIRGPGMTLAPLFHRAFPASAASPRLKGALLLWLPLQNASTVPLFHAIAGALPLVRTSFFHSTGTHEQAVLVPSLHTASALLWWSLPPTASA